MYGTHLLIEKGTSTMCYRCGAYTLTRPNCRHDYDVRMCSSFFFMPPVGGVQYSTHCTSYKLKAWSRCSHPKHPTSSQRTKNARRSRECYRILTLKNLFRFMCAIPVSLTDLHSDPPTIRAVEPTFHATSTLTEDSYAPEDDLKKKQKTRETKC